MKKTFNACKEAGLPEPEIREINGGIAVTIFNFLSGGRISGQIGGQIGGQIDTIAVYLTDRQKDVFIR